MGWRDLELVCSSLIFVGQQLRHGDCNRLTAARDDHLCRRRLVADKLPAHPAGRYHRAKRVHGHDNLNVRIACSGSGTDGDRLGANSHAPNIRFEVDAAKNRTAAGAKDSGDVMATFNETAFDEIARNLD